MKRPASWTPDRQDIIWIDCNSQRGQEIRDVHPFLVLSPKAFNARTSLVTGLPMTTASYNADNPLAITKSFSWLEQSITGSGIWWSTITPAQGAN